MGNPKKQNQYGILSVIGSILCVIFGVILTCNIMIIVKGVVNPVTPPSIFGNTPLVVLSGSMSGNAPDHIEAGDMIFVQKIDPQLLNKGDIISYMDSGVVITHRIIKVQNTESGDLQFITKGDANNAADQLPVLAKDVVGIYKMRIPMAGDAAMFMQTPAGMLIFIGIPLIGYIMYDIIRRQKYAEADRKRSEELELELERLRALTNRDHLDS